MHNLQKKWAATNDTFQEVKVAFYKKSKEYHPDTNPDNADESARKFHQV